MSEMPQTNLMNKTGFKRPFFYRIGDKYNDYQKFTRSYTLPCTAEILMIILIKKFILKILLKIKLRAID